MRKARGQYLGTEQRRSEIIASALACFTEAGFFATTMEDIRRRAGVSNGSVYHHFKSKEQLAAAVYLTGVAEYQAGLMERLGACREAHEGIRAIVGYHLHWVRDHTDWARYLLRMRHADFMTGSENSIGEANAEFVGALGAFFRRHVMAGTLRHLPAELYLALILGPCQELARHWLLAGRSVDLDRAVDELGEAAWRAVSAAAPGTPSVA